MGDLPLTLSFLHRPPPPGFDLRVVVVAPGQTRAYDAAEWADALVVLEAGQLDLHCTRGGRRRFGAGTVLSFNGLSLTSLVNPGLEPAVLSAVSRPPPCPLT